MNTLDFNVVTGMACALVGNLTMTSLLLDLIRLNTNHRVLPRLQWGFATLKIVLQSFSESRNIS